MLAGMWVTSDGNESQMTFCRWKKTCILFPQDTNMGKLACFHTYHRNMQDLWKAVHIFLISHWLLWAPGAGQRIQLPHHQPGMSSSLDWAPVVRPKRVERDVDPPMTFYFYSNHMLMILRMIAQVVSICCIGIWNFADVCSLLLLTRLNFYLIINPILVQIAF
jgi:hypothetical protein